MSIRLGSILIDKIYLGSTEILKAFLGSVLVFDKSTPIVGLDTSYGAYVLEQIYSNPWKKAIIEVIRLSDLVKTWVFIDGNNIGDQVSLSSLTSTTSKSVPDPITLGTFAGGGDIVGYQWYFMTNTNTIDETFTLIQPNSARQPYLVKAGVLMEDNGHVAWEADAKSWFHNGLYNRFPILDYGNSFSIFSIASTIGASQSFAVWSNLSRSTGIEGTNSRINGYISKIASGFLCFIKTSALVNTFIRTTAIGGGFSWRVGTFHMDGVAETISGRINGNPDPNFGEEDVPFVGAYQNDGFVVMAQLLAGNELGNGFFFGVVLFAENIRALGEPTLYAVEEEIMLHYDIVPLSA